MVQDEAKQIRGATRSHFINGPSLLFFARHPKEIVQTRKGVWTHGFLLCNQAPEEHPALLSSTAQQVHSTANLPPDRSPTLDKDGRYTGPHLTREGEVCYFRRALSPFGGRSSAAPSHGRGKGLAWCSSCAAKSEEKEPCQREEPCSALLRVKSITQR